MRQIILGFALPMLVLGIAQAQTPGRSIGNSAARTSGMNNTAVTGVLPGMDANRPVRRSSAENQLAHPPAGGMNNAGVTGNLPGFKAGNLPGRRAPPVSQMKRPVGGLNNAAVSGALPGTGGGWQVSRGNNN